MHQGRAEALTLVLVPGLGLGPEAWAPTVRRLGEPVRTVVPRLPGYGEPARGRDLRPRALAEALVAGPQLPSGTLALAGHSASCQVVAHVAALVPDRVAGVALVGPTTDPRAASWPGLAQRWLRTAAHETPRQVPSLVRQYARTTLPAMLRAMDAARRDRIEPALAAWGGELLVLRGVHDRICPAPWGRAVSASSPSGSLVTLPRGGHMVPLTHGALLAPILDRFVSRVGGGSPRR